MNSRVEPEVICGLLSETASRRGPTRVVVRGIGEGLPGGAVEAEGDSGEEALDLERGGEDISTWVEVSSRRPECRSISG
jgi:hypothetical protein